MNKLKRAVLLFLECQQKDEREWACKNCPLDKSAITWGEHPTLCTLITNLNKALPEDAKGDLLYVK